MSNATSTPQEVTLSRVFDAPRALVWKAWTDPSRMAKWWGPHGFTNPVCELDVRPGGAILIHMQGPDGTVYPMKGTFREIDEPERLVFASSAVPDADGNDSLEVLSTVTFEEEGGKTKLTVRNTIVRATEDAAFALQGMEAGWTQSLEKLAELVED